MDNKEAKTAAEEFLGSADSDIMPIAAGTANQNFIVIDDSGNKFVLRKRSEKYSEQSFVDFEIEYVERLSGFGLPVPQIIKTLSGKKVFMLNGVIWQMSKHIEGNCFNGNTEQIYNSGRCLAAMHDAMTGFMPRNKRKGERYEHPKILQGKYNRLMDIHTEAKCSNGFEWVQKVINKLGKVLDDSAYERIPSLYIHGDYHSANILYMNNEVSGIFDFDCVSYQARIRDVADGIIFFGSVRKSPIDDQDIVSLTQGFEPERSLYEHFIKGYQHKANFKLSEQELELLPYFIAARFIGMRLDGTLKLPVENQLQLLENDIGQPLGWLRENCDI